MEESISENPKNKTIIFSQFRDTVVKISEELNKIPGIISKTFVGQAKKQIQDSPKKNNKK